MSAVSVESKKINFKNRLSQLGHALITPVAMGIYITSIFSVFAIQYYQVGNDRSEKNIFLKTANNLDLWSIDQRFNLRGPRLGSSQVAVLAVDDRSIKIVSRWPWPRDIISRAMENAYQYGAKVIATDIVWSEPTDRSEKKLYTTDPDRMFSEFASQRKEQLVLGHIFDNIIHYGKHQAGSGFKTACHDLILNNSPLQKIIELQSISPLVMDPFISKLPEVLSQNYAELIMNEEINLKSLLTKSNSKFENHEIETKLLNMKEDLCENLFLNPENKDDIISESAAENWQLIKDTDAKIKFNSYNEWLINFKKNYFTNTVPESLTGVFNLPEFIAKSKNFGFFDANLDADGSIRQSQLLIRSGSAYIPSIALQAYLVATNQNIEIQMEPDEKVIGLKGIKKLTVINSNGQPQFDIPVTSSGAININYAGPQQTIPHASIADLLNKDNPNILVSQQVYDKENGWHKENNFVSKKTFFKDKILIIGVTAIGVYDLRVTPFDENFPGVETHANVVDNLMRQDFLSQNRKEKLFVPLFMIALGLVLSFFLSYFGAISSLIFSVLVIAIVLYIDKTLLFTQGHLVSTILPIIQVLFTYTFLNFYKYFTEERSKKELRATFSKYVSPAIVEEILKDPKNLELGGRKERVTVFFSDIRDFTTISEKLDPKVLSDLLNSYLTPMTELVFKNRGTLDKYMGDAIMAFFGAPVHDENHAKMACRCALQNLEKLKELQIKYARRGLPFIDIGIGLNTGECNVGNMGSQTVRSYTVMGDVVNLASRLEGINKTYGTHIIISEYTYEEVKSDFLCREIDWVRVKGKINPVKIYELLTENHNSSMTVPEAGRHFSDGYAYYREKQFEKAIQLFEIALEQNPNDKTSKIYIKRCHEFIATPPPPDWDGVYVIETK